MAREDKLVERITYLTKIALGEEPNKDFSEAIIALMIKAAKMGYNFAVDEACEWIERNYHTTPMGGYYYLPEDCIEQFRKAMKGD